MLIGLRFSEERRQHGNAINLLRRRDAGNFSGCRKEIPKTPDVLIYFAGFHVTRPADDGRLAKPAFIKIRLVTAQRT